MTNAGSLFAAFGVIWLAVLLYMVRLGVLRRNLEARLDVLEERLETGEADR